jgi:hypothetical protein
MSSSDVERTIGNPPNPPCQGVSDDVGAATCHSSSSGEVSRKAPGVSGDAGLITRASADGSLNAGSLSTRASDDGRPPVVPSSGVPVDTVLERWIEWCREKDRAVVCFANTDTSRDEIADSIRTGVLALRRTERWAREHGCGELEVRRV